MTVHGSHLHVVAAALIISHILMNHQILTTNRRCLQPLRYRSDRTALAHIAAAHHSRSEWWSVSWFAGCMDFPLVERTDSRRRAVVRMGCRLAVRRGSVGRTHRPGHRDYRIPGKKCQDRTLFVPPAVVDRGYRHCKRSTANMGLTAMLATSPNEWDTGVK